MGQVWRSEPQQPGATGRPARWLVAGVLARLLHRLPRWVFTLLGIIGGAVGAAWAWEAIDESLVAAAVGGAVGFWVGSRGVFVVLVVIEAALLIAIPIIVFALAWLAYSHFAGGA
jgi:hypothetical protein